MQRNLILGTILSLLAFFGHASSACDDNLLVPLKLNGPLGKTSYNEVRIFLTSKGFKIRTPDQTHHFEFSHGWNNMSSDNGLRGTRNEMNFSFGRIVFSDRDQTARLYENPDSKKSKGTGIKFYASKGYDFHYLVAIPFFYRMSDLEEVDVEKDLGQIENFYQTELAQVPLRSDEIPPQPFKKDTGKRFTCAGDDSTYGGGEGRSFFGIRPKISFTTKFR